MHDYTPRQITHIGDSMMRDRTFVLNMISAAFGGKGNKNANASAGAADLSASKRRAANRSAGVSRAFDNAAPGELTPGSRRFDLRGMTQKQARMQCCAIMGQTLKE